MGYFDLCITSYTKVEYIYIYDYALKHKRIFIIIDEN